MKKVILLFNGGVDSVAAALQLKSLQFDVLLLNFQTAFCGGPSKRLSETVKALKLPALVVPLHFIHFSALGRPEAPANQSPCAICRALMLRYAFVLQKLLKFDFLVTGDVFNQYSDTQSEKAVATIDKRSGIPTPPVRILSKRFFNENNQLLQKSGILRTDFHDIQGSGHREQLKLLKSAGICLYNEMSGCLLRRGFGSKLSVLKADGVFLTQTKEFINLVRIGMLFRAERLKYAVVVRGSFAKKVVDNFRDVENVFWVYQEGVSAIFGFQFDENKLQQLKDSESTALVDQDVLRDAKKAFEKIKQLQAKGERLIVVTLENNQIADGCGSNGLSDQFPDLLVAPSEELKNFCLEAAAYVVGTSKGSIDEAEYITSGGERLRQHGNLGFDFQSLESRLFR